jgi:hypothetical protein
MQGTSVKPVRGDAIGRLTFWTALVLVSFCALAGILASTASAAPVLSTSGSGSGVTESYEALSSYQSGPYAFAQYRESGTESGAIDGSFTQIGLSVDLGGFYGFGDNGSFAGTIGSCGYVGDETYQLSGTGTEEDDVFYGSGIIQGMSPVAYEATFQQVGDTFTYHATLIVCANR